MTTTKSALAWALPILAAGMCSAPAPPPSPGTGFDCANQPELSGLVKVKEPIADKYIVVYRAEAARVRALPLRSRRGVREVESLGGNGYSARIEQDAVASVLADESVAYVQQDGKKHISSLSWGLDRIDQRDRPLDNTYDVQGDAAGVNVAIIDTGIHPDLDFGDRLVLNCFSAHPGGCDDQHGHGTHVAGTVGGTLWGVAKKAKLWAVRVLDASGSGSDSAVVKGIEWVTARKLEDPQQDWAANMSLGGSPAPALDQAVCRAIAAGVSFAVAAGNETEDANTSSPARVRQALTVGAMDQGDRQASFSNYGALLDLYAPGVNIESINYRGGSTTMSGTSMASPHVAGAAAVYLGAHPHASPQAVADALVEGATHGGLGWVSTGSPNELLFIE